MPLSVDKDGSVIKQNINAMFKDSSTLNSEKKKKLISTSVEKNIFI